MHGHMGRGAEPRAQSNPNRQSQLFTKYLNNSAVKEQSFQHCPIQYWIVRYAHAKSKTEHYHFISHTNLFEAVQRDNHGGACL